jgi:ubiquinone/menaquinone biosynthesis C-methylase UbiE
MNMNSFEGKRILALIREGDYAHAGEEEAIERTFRSVPKNPAHWILDVGCGRGGSAEYVRRNGFGNLVGIDREADSIEYASNHYPKIDFHPCDVLDVPRVLARKFDVIYMLNAFYAFARQRDALTQLRKVAKPGARLVIFDYTVRGESGADSLSVEGQMLIPHPLRLSAFSTMLTDSDWETCEVEDLSPEYERWYAALVARIHQKQNEIEQVGGAEWYRFVLATYTGLYDAIVGGALGGAIVTALAA